MDFTRLMQTAAVPGLSLAVIRDFKVADVQAYGVCNTVMGEPVTPATVFQAASLTKPLAAYGALLLHQAGRLDLTQPLHEVLPHPDLADDPRAKRLTMAMVLSHTTGLPNWRTMEPDKVLRIKREPGTAFEYSGEGYVYLQRVIEHLTGQPFDLYIAEQVLAPLGLEDTCFVWSERFAGRTASTHGPDGKPEEPWRPLKPNAAYTAHTTPADFARFMQAVMRGEGPLSPELARAMITPHVQVRGAVSWGLGWGLTEGQAFWQWGDNGGAKNFATGDPVPGNGVVIMTNGCRGLRICNRIVKAVLGQSSPAFADFLRPFYGRKGW